MPGQRIFAVRSTRLTRALLAAAATLLLAGCPTKSVIQNLPGVVNGQPQPVNNPVLIKLDWSGVQGRIGSPSASLDGASVNTNFGLGGGGCCTAQATFILTPGQHQINVSVPRSATYGLYSESLPFIVRDPTFTLAASPASLTLTPGAMATVNVTATAVNGFNGTVTPGVPTVTPAGSGATATSTGAMAFTVNVTAGMTAGPGSVSVPVNGMGCTNCTTQPTVTATIPLTIVGPGVSITSVTPSSPLIPRAGSQSVTVTVARSGGFTGPVAIGTGAIANGITATTTTIPMGSTTGSITFSAKDSSGLAAIAAGALASPTATVTATGSCTPACPGVTASANVTLRIGHRVGAFVVAPASLKSAGSATSADNASTLQYALRNPPYPNHTLFTATFRRANTGTTQLAAIDLEQSPIDWGAGFCTASPTVAGLVLSQPYGGQTNAQLYYDLPIWAPSPSTAAARVVSTQPVYTSMGNVPLSITPQLWYSPDCTIAAYPTATGVQAQPSALTIIDMRTGTPIGTQMSFSGGFPTKIEVVGTATQENVKVTFSPTDIRQVTIP